LWEAIGNRFSISPKEITEQPWPAYRPELLIEDEVEIVLQVNGKVRDRVTVPLSTLNTELEVMALANERIKEFTHGLTIRKVVVIPKKLVNVVAS
jgi:leucyl-tRNA synthetase